MGYLSRQFASQGREKLLNHIGMLVVVIGDWERGLLVSLWGQGFLLGNTGLSI